MEITLSFYRLVVCDGDVWSCGFRSGTETHRVKNYSKASLQPTSTRCRRRAATIATVAAP